MRIKLALSFIASIFTTCLFAQPTPILVKDINPNGSLIVKSTCVYKDKLFFAANDGDPNSGINLWCTDGSENGTVKVSSVKVSYNPKGNNFIEYKGLLFFTGDGGTGKELWVTDGTEAGTKLFYEINPTKQGEPKNYTIFKDKLFFTANDEIHGEKLWVTDGTVQGTKIFSDNHPDRPRQPTNLTVCNNKLFFVASDSLAPNDELWVIDDTETGAEKIEIDPDESSNPRYLCAYRDNLYFLASTPTLGDILWKSDGTVSGTKPVISSNPMLYPTQMIVCSDKLFFTGNYNNTGSILCTSDGTDTGTKVFKDKNSNEIKDPAFLVSTSLGLFFTDGKIGSGLEPWFSDGTPSGTNIIRNSLYSASGYFEYHKKVYFSAGRYMWETDGSDIGTRKVEIPNPKQVSVFIPGGGHFTIYKDTLFFLANFDSLGNELYKMGSAKPIDSSSLSIKRVNELKVNIYPNPATDFVNIEFDDIPEGEVSIEIYDIAGRIIESNLYTTYLKNNILTLSVNQLLEGIYILNIKSEHKVMSIRLVIE